jgi:hypothetical protein
MRYNMSHFANVARDVVNTLNTRVAATDRDAEWQRVNSYIADVLKDAHVLYAKLARLQGDFAGKELDELEKISEGVLAIGGKLSTFSKSFYEGAASMIQEDVYGAEEKPLFGGSEGSAEGISLNSAPLVQEESASEETSGSSEAEPVEMEFDYSQETEPEDSGSSSEAD